MTNPVDPTVHKPRRACEPDWDKAAEVYYKESYKIKARFRIASESQFLYTKPEGLTND